MKLSLKSAESFKNVLTALSSLVEEADFTFGADGVTTSAVDPSHIAMLRLTVNRGFFEAYEGNGEQTRLSLVNLLKLLKSAKSGDSLELSFDTENNKVTLVMAGKVKKTFVTPTYVAEPTEDRTINSQITSVVTMPSALFSELVEDTRDIADNVTLETKYGEVKEVPAPNLLVITATGQMSKAGFDVQTSEDTMVNIKELAKSTYNGEYLSDIAKGGSSVSEKAVLSLGQDTVLQATFEAPNVTLNFFLAPRVE